MLTTEQVKKIDWQKQQGLVPAIVQHAVSGEVLMLGYMTEEALTSTMSSGYVTFYSRSRKTLWKKGETSGNFLQLKDIYLDCDGDTLLVMAMPLGPTCHTGANSCFSPAASRFQFLYDLEQTIVSRKSAEPASSYTAKLFASGTKRIAQKVGEEGVETALAATVHNQEELINESADLLYHLLVLLQDQNTDLDSVIHCLELRHQQRK